MAGTGARIGEVRLVRLARGHYQLTAVEEIRHRGGKVSHQHIADPTDIYGSADDAEELAQHAKDALFDQGFDEVAVRST